MLSRCANAFVLTLKINEDRKLIFKNAASTANRFFRINRSVCFDINDQLIEVSTLFNSCSLNVISHPVNRAE